VPNVHRLANCFGRTRWNSLVTWVKWKLILVRLEIVLISAQDRCMICVECTTDMEIFRAHPMELLGDMGQVEAHFGMFGNSVNLSAR
jgi:hypothetical protein